MEDVYLAMRDMEATLVNELVRLVAFDSDDARLAMLARVIADFRASSELLLDLLDRDES